MSALVSGFDTSYLRRQFFKSEFVLKESLWFCFSKFYGKNIFLLIIFSYFHISIFQLIQLKIYLFKVLNALLRVRTKEFSGVCFKEDLNKFLTENFTHLKEHLIAIAIIESYSFQHLTLKSS